MLSSFRKAYLSEYAFLQNTSNICFVFLVYNIFKRTKAELEVESLMGELEMTRKRLVKAQSEAAESRAAYVDAEAKASRSILTRKLIE
ncbi:unnamed protein product [Protopolystoma xenopodis]|uniref:Uncharacterized protein n=1 Tax=Protopolystoma xenopodis TaxID=117903 RepID=A0A3S5CGQ3_9PLAT|nr:unnamed protein product [Protopolystoma xenopodis]